MFFSPVNWMNKRMFSSVTNLDLFLLLHLSFPR